MADEMQKLLHLFRGHRERQVWIYLMSMVRRGRQYDIHTLKELIVEKRKTELADPEDSAYHALRNIKNILAHYYENDSVGRKARKRVVFIDPIHVALEYRSFGLFSTIQGTLEDWLRPHILQVACCFVAMIVALLTGMLLGLPRMPITTGALF